MSLHILPFVGTLGYLYYPKELRLNPRILFFITIIHNSILIGFSLWTFMSLVKILLREGIVIKSNYYFRNDEFDKIIFYFYLSKYYEYIDTFLIYLRGNEPLFLQKYHHVGTAIIWHLGYCYKGDAIWIPTLYNSFVHTVMYSYYLGSQFKIQSFKKYKSYITSMQIFQLVSQFSTLYLYKPPVDSDFNYKLSILSNIFTLGLLILFCEFYYKNYNVEKKKN